MTDLTALLDRAELLLRLARESRFEGSTRVLVRICDDELEPLIRLARAAGKMREALEAVLEVSRDRAAFVAQGPRAFARAERIAQAALKEFNDGQ